MLRQDHLHVFILIGPLLACLTGRPPEAVLPINLFVQ